MPIRCGYAYFRVNKTSTHKCVVPRVRYESELALRRACEQLLFAYTELTHYVVGAKFRARGLNALSWTELDRLMLGIASFEEISDGALHLVLASTGGSGALYAHELNSRVARCINRHNEIFFHETTSVNESELRAGLAGLLARMLLTSSHSHYEALLSENFRCFVAWDSHEWLLCPRHLVCEYQKAIVDVGAAALLPYDIVLEILGFLGLRGRV